MKVKIPGAEATKVEVEVKAKFRDVVRQAEVWGDKDSRNFSPRFLVSVKTSHGRAQFDYHCSQVDYEKGKDTLSDNDLLWALVCFIGDGVSGEYDIDEFFNEFGYEEGVKMGLKAYKACQRANRQVKRLFPEHDIWDLLYEVREMADE